MFVVLLCGSRYPDIRTDIKEKVVEKPFISLPFNPPIEGIFRFIVGREPDSLVCPVRVVPVPWRRCGD